MPGFADFYLVRIAESAIRFYYSYMLSAIYLSTKRRYCVKTQDEWT